MGEEQDTTAVTPATGPSGVRPTLIVGGVRVNVRADSLVETVSTLESSLIPSEIPTSGLLRYAPIRELGRGGMGKVDVVFDRALGRAVARKTALDDRHAALLVTEARICAQLEHPSIVPVYELSADDQGQPQYTMRVVPGVSLRDILHTEEQESMIVSRTQLLGILRQVCLAVEFAHQRGVVHRDLKPENIIVGEFGEVYVLDWGVAFVSPHSDVHRSLPGGVTPRIAGSPGYMAPEQMRGDRLDARTDVFALGAILLEVAVGERAFEERTMEEVHLRIASGGVRESKLDAVGCLSKELEELCRACLEAEMEARPRTARRVAEAIEAYLDAERDRTERQIEALEHVQCGDEAEGFYRRLDREAQELQESADEILSAIKPWEPVEKKQVAWEKLGRSKHLRAEAARALAEAEAAYTRALGRFENQPGARAGLASLYYRQFLEAEEEGDDERMAQFLALARTYDAGALHIELSGTGLLSVEAGPERADVELHRYEADGLLLRASTPLPLGRAPVAATAVPAGSYLIVARSESGATIRYPVCIARARRHHARLRFRDLDPRITHGFELVAGGPFLAFAPSRKKQQRASLPDFLIAKFPVTLGAFGAFLAETVGVDSDHPWVPGHNFSAGSLITVEGGKVRLAPHAVEGAARARIHEGNELDVPAFAVRWYGAAQYAKWFGARIGAPARLPTDLEWEKAMRGADGRNYPMGNQLDPSFAKLRDSRPEATQAEPIGAFPLDESPYGVRDLAGGIGDWTSSMVDGLAPPALEDEGKPEADERVAYWRGGNWGIHTLVREMRFTLRLASRTNGVGFRLAIPLEGESSDLEQEPIRSAAPQPSS